MSAGSAGSRFATALLACCAFAPAVAGAEARLATHNVILVTLDGVRQQDVFGGLDEVVAKHDEQQVYSDMPAMRARYGGATPESRRARLMPRLWDELVPRGMAFGNPAHANQVIVQNEVLWSTPGYVEMLTGAPREPVADNEPRRYPWPTALELAREQLGLDAGSVALFGSWDGYALAAASRAGRFVMIGAYDDVPRDYSTPGIDQLNALRREVMGLWTEGSNDMLTYRMARSYIEENRPRLMWLALVNSDDWAHADRYDRYLEYLNRADAMLGELWDLLQSTEGYRDRTTVIVTTDHGRGRRGDDWAEHDAAIPGSDEIWLVIVGPDTPETGEVREAGTLYQGQVAATILRLLGVDWRVLGPDALPPVDAAIAPR